MLEPGFRIWLPGMLWHYNLRQTKLFKDFVPKKSNLVCIFVGPSFKKNSIIGKGILEFPQNGQGVLKHLNYGQDILLLCFFLSWSIDYILYRDTIFYRASTIRLGIDIEAPFSPIEKGIPE